jgi:hypothetical protein
MSFAVIIFSGDLFRAATYRLMFSIEQRCALHQITREF